MAIIYNCPAVYVGCKLVASIAWTTANKHAVRQWGTDDLCLFPDLIYFGVSRGWYPREGAANTVGHFYVIPITVIHMSMSGGEYLVLPILKCCGHLAGGGARLYAGGLRLLSTRRP